MKVCLDAGHYGKYNKSPAVSAYYESERMWVLTELLAKELTKRGIVVIKTRSNKNVDMELTDRGRKASGCDLFVSLHSNAVGSYVNETVDYPVSYVLIKDDDTKLDELSTEIGLLLAKSVQAVMGTTQAARTSTRAASGDRNRDGKLNDDYYGVLYGAKQVGVPAVILEHSFHTNTKSTNWLLLDSNLQKLASAEADVIYKWLKSTATNKPSAKPVLKPETAKHKSSQYIKTYTVKSALHMRYIASNGTEFVRLLKKGEQVTCYGYYNLVGSEPWLYVADCKGLTGYFPLKYLA